MRGVVVGRAGLELRRAGVDRLEGANSRAGPVSLRRQGPQLPQEPWVDGGPLPDPARVDAAPERLQDQVIAVVSRGQEAVEQLIGVVGYLRLGVELAGAHRLGERLAEGAADRHRLPHRLHVGREASLGPRELLEREPRHLGDHVVDRRLEGGGGCLRDVVGDLLERVADRQLGGDLGDREPGGLRGQRRGARDAGVHLDHHHLAGARFDRELDVRAAGLDPDGPDHTQGLVAQLLEEAIGERLGGSHRDAVPGVDAHRVDVLDRADDDHVVVAIAHHLELELAPAEHRLFQQHLIDRAGREALRDDLVQLGGGPSDASPMAAQGVRGPHDRGQLDPPVGQRPLRLADAMHDLRPRNPKAGALHRLAEGLAVLGAADRLVVGSDQLHPAALEHLRLVERRGEVERRLAAEGGQQRVRPLALDDPLHRVRGQRLHVGAVGELGVGHDRGRVGVDEHHLVAVGEQHLARLGARVVELRRLADHDRPRADQEDLPDVVAPRHNSCGGCAALPASAETLRVSALHTASSRKRSNR